MKYCFECGHKLEGNEKICPECGCDLDIIEINKRRTDKVYFESAFIQSLSDKLDIFFEDANNILKEFDSSDFKKQMDEMDIVDISEETLDQFSDLKDETLNDSTLGEIIDKTSRDARIALNRDIDYVNHAKRKLKRLDENKNIKYDKTNLRVVELSNKAIDLNECNPEAYYVKGIALINLRKYDEGIEELIKSLSLDEDNINPKLEIARANILTGQFEDAISIYDSILENDESSFEAIKGKAAAYYEMEDYKKSADLFKKANDIEKLDDESQEKLDSCLDNLN